MKKRKIIIVCLTVLAIILGIFFVIYLSSVSSYRNKVRNIEVGEIDLSAIPDGIYTGECDVGFIYVQAEVAVAKGRIENIDLLEHKNGRGNPAEIIIKKVINEQSLDIDAVSGATNSSKVILKAIQNALKENENMGLFDKSIRKNSDVKTPEQRKQESITILKNNNIKVLAGLPVIESYEETAVRSKEEIVQRALALCIISVYAEGVYTGTEVKENQEFIRKIINKYGAKDFFTEKENEFLNSNNPSQTDAINFSWQYECYNVMLWALGFVEELPIPNAICDVPKIVKILQESETYSEFYDRAVVIDKEEILDQADLIYRYDWACVDARINNLEINNIDSGVVLERHRALNWLINYFDQDWDDVSTDT